jgi:hypothetical protein
MLSLFVPLNACSYPCNECNECVNAAPRSPSDPPQIPLRSPQPPSRMFEQPAGNIWDDKSGLPPLNLLRDGTDLTLYQGGEVGGSSRSP